MARDFHTHCPARSVPALVSTERELTEEALCSLEMHPWSLPENKEELPGDFCVRLSRFAALGEVGLDALRGPAMEIQRHYLRRLFSVAQTAHKPVILHIVRGWQVLKEEVKGFSLPFCIHGFRGKGELLLELWSLGFGISFHPSVVQNEGLLALLRHPQGKFGFESDDDPGADVAQIIRTVQEKSGNPDIEALSDDYFEEFLSYGKF